MGRTDRWKALNHNTLQSTLLNRRMKNKRMLIVVKYVNSRRGLAGNNDKRLKTVNIHHAQLTLSGTLKHTKSDDGKKSLQIHCNELQRA